MNTFQNIILIALCGNAAIGFVVWGANPKRSLNRYFLFTTGLIAYWLLCMFVVTLQAPSEGLTFWTRQVSAAAGFLPLGFFILQRIISEPKIRISTLLAKTRFLLLVSAGVLILCQTDFFMRKAYYANADETVPAGDYGAGFLLYIAYFLASMIGMALSIPKMFKRTTGVQRQEGLFLLLGWLIGFSFGVVLFTTSTLMGTQEATRFLPLFPLIMNTVVAYGVATRRILSISVFSQRFIAYILSAVYLIFIYIAAEWLIAAGFNCVIPDTTYLSHLVAALAVAFSMIPAHNWMQQFSCRLFATSNQFDAEQILNDAERIFQEVSTEETLLESFSDFISNTFRTTRIALLDLVDNDSYIERYSYPQSEGAERLKLHSGSSLIHLINRDRQSFTADTLERMRATPLVQQARQEMNETGAVIAIGCFLHKELKMVVLLYPKKSGSIYDLREQRTLQRLCNQLSVARENAQLYTKARNSKIYNDILLDSLTSGIIAINETRQITVFNQRAQLITRLKDSEILNQSVDQLPEELIDIVNHIFDTDTAVRDVDTFIESSEDWIPIRVSGSAFHGYTGEQLGVLLVFSDMTRLRKMEEKIRRTDRLASIGTLSAGMAHEIKNPLVTVKTFTELLPEQYDDPEFRGTFVDLVQQEVRRIDSIVNRLLNFARPAKAALKPTKLHDVIDNSIRLVEQQLNNKSIHLNRQLKAKSDLVMADAEQINQALINLFMNAIQAMSPNGTLSIVSAEQENMLCIDVSDTGCGISDEQQKYVFDPFFSTKERGVGLGLSVSHGIINEHLGRISIESRKGEGTTFHLELPLADEKEILSE